MNFNYQQMMKQAKMMQNHVPQNTATAAEDSSTIGADEAP